MAKTLPNTGCTGQVNHVRTRLFLNVISNDLSGDAGKSTARAILASGWWLSLVHMPASVTLVARDTFKVSLKPGYCH